MSDEKIPDWYDEKKLRRVYYAKGYSGWVIDLGDGTCRLVNNPLLGKKGPKWGDRVQLIESSNCINASNIIERYEE